MTRRLIVARQNETVRRYGGEEIDLATMDLSNCYAVVITNDQGDASLTHVDASTDLKFIEEEYNSFGSTAKICIIYSADNSQLESDLLLNMRPELVPSKSNGIGTLPTNTCCVIVLPNNKFFLPIKAQLELSTQGIYSEEQKNTLRKNIADLKEKHPEFNGAYTDYGPEFFLRDRLAQIETVICGINEFKRDRIVIFDKGQYLRYEYNLRLSPQVAEKVDSLRCEYEEKVLEDDRGLESLVKFLNAKFQKYVADEFAKKIVEEELAQSLLNYWQYSDRIKGACHKYIVVDFDNAKAKIVNDRGGRIETLKNNVAQISIHPDALKSINNGGIREKLGLHRVAGSNLSDEQIDFLKNNSKLSATLEKKPDLYSSYYITFIDSSENRKLVKNVIENWKNFKKQFEKSELISAEEKQTNLDNSI